MGIHFTTETHLKDHIDSQEVHIEGYELHRMDRKKDKPGGGCALYVKENLNITVMTEYNTDDIEGIWIELHHCSQRLLIGSVYRPPDDSSFYIKFQIHFEKIWRKKTNVLIVRDLNSDLMLYGKSEEEKYLGRKILKILNNFNSSEHQQELLYPPKQL